MKYLLFLFFLGFLNAQSYEDIVIEDTIGMAGNLPEKGKGYALGIDTGGFYVFAGYTEDPYDAWIVKYSTQTHDTVWMRFYGGGGDDRIYDMAIDSTGNYVFVGYTTSYGVGGKDIWILKVSPRNGETLRTWVYGGSNDDVAYGITVDGSGDYLITGETKSFGDQKGDCFLMKIDPDVGDTVWFRQYGTVEEDAGYDVAVDTAGNYVISGLYYFLNTSPWGDVWILKIEPQNGDTLWTHNFGDSQGQTGYGIVVDDSNYYVVAAKTYSQAYRDNMWVLKIEPEAGGLVWQREYGGVSTGNERCYSVSVDKEGYYVLAGYTSSYGAGGTDAWVLKVNPDNGDTLWTHTYGTENDDRAMGVKVAGDSVYVMCGYDGAHFTAREIKSSNGAVKDSMDFSLKWINITNLDDKGYDIALDSSNFYVMAGYSESDETGKDVLIVKYNPETRDTVWTRLYGGLSDDVAYSVCVDRYGYYVIAGYTESSGAGGKDLWVLKVSPLDGDTIWSRHYGGTSDEVAKGVTIDMENNYIVAGYTKSYGAGGGDLWVLKINSVNGDTVWTRVYGGDEFDGGEGVVVDTAGDYVVCGNTWTYDPGDLENAWILKLNHETGDTLWTKSYGDGGGQHAYDVIVDRDGNCVVSAKTTFHTTDDAWVLKLNPQTGDTLWTVHYGTDRNEKGFSIAQDKEGYYVVAGFTDKRSSDNPDYFIGKISPDSGKLLFTRRLGGNGWDIARGVIVDNDSFYVVMGYSNSTFNGDYDIYLVKYNPWDLNPPEIKDVTQIEDDNSYPYGPFDVWATIEDKYSGVSEAILHWKTELDTYFRDIVMNEVPYNNYKATIPEIFTTLDSLRLFYYVSAKDGAENESSSDTLSFYIITSSGIGEKENHDDMALKIPSMVKTGDFKISLSLSEGTKYSLNVFSKDGRLIWSRHDVFTSGKSTVVAPPLKRGVYFIELRTKGTSKVKKFVII